MLFKAIVAASTLVFTQVGFGEDLPDQVTTKRRASFVDVYDVVSLKITDQVYTPPAERKVGRLLGLLNVELSVEGNICGNEPSSLAVTLVMKREVFNVSLITSTSYNPVPGVTTACLQYSKGSVVTIPIALDDRLILGHPNAPHKYLIELYDETSKLVTVSIDSSGQAYQATVEDSQ